MDANSAAASSILPSCLFRPLSSSNLSPSFPSSTLLNLICWIQKGASVFQERNTDWREYQIGKQTYRQEDR